MSPPDEEMSSLTGQGCFFWHICGAWEISRVRNTACRMKWEMWFTSRFPCQGLFLKYQLNLSQALLCIVPAGYAIYFFQRQERRECFHLFIDLLSSTGFRPKLKVSLSFFPVCSPVWVTDLRTFQYTVLTCRNLTSAQKEHLNTCNGHP